MKNPHLNQILEEHTGFNLINIISHNAYMSQSWISWYLDIDTLVLSLAIQTHLFLLSILGDILIHSNDTGNATDFGNIFNNPYTFRKISLAIQENMFVLEHYAVCLRRCLSF